MSDLDTFRDEVRLWLDRHCPPEMREPIRGEGDMCWGGRNPVFQSDAQRDWMNAMAERGWTVPDWPKAYGGGGLSAAETRIFKQEMARIGARNPLMSFGISMLGPALLRYGRGAEDAFLPEIARRRNPLCQGYSEPNAGSRSGVAPDPMRGPGRSLAVNGQKVWNQLCRQADWIFASCAHSRPPSTRGSASSCSTWRARACRPPDPADFRQLALLETFFDDGKVRRTRSSAK